MMDDELLLEKPAETKSQSTSTPVHIVVGPQLRVTVDAHARPAIRPRKKTPFSVSTAFSRLLAFRRKYRWYRALGYTRAAAREKAWWHARTVPCPFAAP